MKKAQSVHPRACGEHAAISIAIILHDRFIPAPAGNTHRRCGYLVRTGGSSPRLRGTLQNQVQHVHRQVGSSPRLRGTLGRIPHGAAPPGSSPRLRGTPHRLRRITAPGTVHPRACGEHIDYGDTIIQEYRFIPAPAGNTVIGVDRGGGHGGSSPRLRGTPVRWTGPDRKVPVHPRACGEHEMLRGRGHRYARFIPAPAGNTLPSIYR